MKKLNSAREVVDHLGGLPRVCAITGANKKQAQYWDRSAAFPAATYCVMQRALRRRKATAHPSLWNMRGFENAA